MVNRSSFLLLVLLVAGALAAGLAIYRARHGPLLGPDTYETEHTEYHPPQADPEDVLVDDQLEDKKPLTFDPALVDRRPLEHTDGWLLNASAAVIRLDVPAIKPDVESELLTLFPSYAAATRSGPAPRAVILPSVNLIDGKAKQFDDGLYAALDQAYYRGLQGKLQSHVGLVRRLYDCVGPDNPAAPFLAAGLELAGVHVRVADATARDRFLAAFRASEVRSKPIGFYTWNRTLEDCFRFLRFFQHEFNGHDWAIPFALALALAQDRELLADYRKAVAFYARLTNPYICLSVADLVGVKDSGGAQLDQLFRDKKVEHRTVALFPASTSRETVLFEKLFPLGLPPDADLMRALIRRLRSGEVDLRPGPDSGWYDYQVYALETLLLPEKGEEQDKLLLTRAYKKRMLEAFQALLTKRRETHVRQLAVAAPGSARLPEDVRPRLRLEPCPTYYLRTARAYAFLANFLEAVLGKEVLRELHGLGPRRSGEGSGERQPDLLTELHGQRDLFYGLYLVSAEDIGLKPGFARGEPVNPEHCRTLAEKWLAGALSDPDLAQDTRVAVPVYVDPGRGVTRLWVTLGVRLARLEASYARPPSIKPARGKGEWQEVDKWRLGTSVYLIPVDEFAEVELPDRRVLTRAELRAVCDREKTREAILRALRE